MIPVVSSEEMRRIDQQASEAAGIPSLVLMENAGRNAAELIAGYCRENFLKHICIIAGKGNNGGDGFVIARYLEKADFQVLVLMTFPAEQLSPDAFTNYEICRKSGTTLRLVTAPADLPDALSEAGLIIDALLGTGLQGAVSGWLKEVIDWINTRPQPVIAIDIPSGLSADMAGLPGSTVQADLTITMALPKLSQLFYPARSKTGVLKLADIGLPAGFEQNIKTTARLVYEADVALPESKPWQHKYSAGKVLIIGGSTGMTGALTLAAAGAQLSGAGMIYTALPASLNPVIEVKLTEVLSQPLSEAGPGYLGISAFDEILERVLWADAVLIGPGLGRRPETVEFCCKLIRFLTDKNKLSVIDADALFALSQETALITNLTEQQILTPHHGEFIRLWPGQETALQNQPWKILSLFTEKTKAVVNLKSATSMVGQKTQGCFINSTGNAALAKGGSGDILAGLTAGFLARGLSPLQSAISANFWLGRAADLAVSDQSARVTTPSDILIELKKLL